MNFSKLTKASDYDVQNWLIKELNLTPYQQEKLRDNESIRFSPFLFYRIKKKEKVSFLWRLTLLIYPIYVILTIIAYYIKWIITGEKGFGQKFLDNFHYKWANKLNI